jgi:predicted acylesterase/phospholipase RssA
LKREINAIAKGRTPHKVGNAFYLMPNEENDLIKEVFQVCKNLKFPTYSQLKNMVCYFSISMIFFDQACEIKKKSHPDDSSIFPPKSNTWVIDFIKRHPNIKSKRVELMERWRIQARNQQNLRQYYNMFLYLFFLI